MSDAIVKRTAPNVAMTWRARCDGNMRRNGLPYKRTVFVAVPGRSLACLAYSLPC